MSNELRIHHLRFRLRCRLRHHHHYRYFYISATKNVERKRRIHRITKKNTNTIRSHERVYDAVVAIASAVKVSLTRNTGIDSNAIQMCVSSFASIP